MNPTDYKKSVLNICRKLEKMISEESEPNCSTAKNFLNSTCQSSSIEDILKKIVHKQCVSTNASNNQAFQMPEFQTSNNHWAESLGNCSLELIFLQSTVWLKQDVWKTDFVPTNKLRKTLQKIIKNNSDADLYSSQPGPSGLSLKISKISSEQSRLLEVNHERKYPKRVRRPKKTCTIGCPPSKSLSSKPTERSLNNPRKLISLSDEENSQLTPDLFDASPEINNIVYPGDSGIQSMQTFRDIVVFETDQNDNHDVPAKKRKKEKERKFISPVVLSTFLFNTPFNNVGLQVVRVLFSALERKDAARNSTVYWEDIKEAVDSVVSFINLVEQEEAKYPGYVSLCISAALNTIRETCLEYNDENVEEMQRLILVTVIMELCNNKEICTKTITMTIEKIHQFTDSINNDDEPILLGAKKKIIVLNHGLNLAINNYCKKFFGNSNEKVFYFGKKQLQSDSAESSKELRIMWVKKLKTIYSKNREIFPKLAFSAKKLSDLLIVHS